MRTGIFFVLISLAAAGAQGCAAGSEDPSLDDETRNVALAAPNGNAANLPPRGEMGDDSLAARARAPKVPAFAILKPFIGTSCKINAFCDDFEDGAPGARWTGAVTTLGLLDFAGPSSSAGANSLHVATNGAGGAAYLSLAGKALGSQWAGALAVTMRIDAPPTTVIGGPEIAVAHTGGGMTRIGFSIRPEGIALHQYFDACSGSSCATRSDIVSEVKAGEWRRLVVAVETTNSVAPPYGRVEVTIDGGELIVLPLTVAPFNGTAEVHAGITVADSVPSNARIDDVVFFTH